MTRCCLAICLGTALVWSAGCGSPQTGPSSTTVKGTITLDKKAIPTGEIHFSVPGVPPSALTITDGNFSGEASIGKNQVEVFIYVEGPPSEKYGGTRSKTNVAPGKYWGPKTELNATVIASGPNEFKFELTSR